MERPGAEVPAPDLRAEEVSSRTLKGCGSSLLELCQWMTYYCQVVNQFSEGTT